MARGFRVVSFVCERLQIGDHVAQVGGGKAFSIVIGHCVGVTIDQVRPGEDDRLVEILLGAERGPAFPSDGSQPVK